MARSAKPKYDVFLCHNSQDKTAVKAIDRRLRDNQIRTWLDERELRPGFPWQRSLEKQIDAIAAAAVFVGESGLGPWQEMELEGFLRQFVKRGCPVIPVILAECTEVPELPVFLAGMTWVDLRQPDPDPLRQLLWGITGNKESNPEPTYVDDNTRELAEALEEAYRREEELMTRGEDPGKIRQEILRLRRELREGGQLKAGDSLLDGRFRLLEPLGKGGFATVFKAFDRQKRELVAIKVLHPQYAQDRTRRERFFRGARKMGQLRHPGIVQVLDPELEDAGYHFFTMEYVEGGDLRQAILDKRLTRDHGLQVVLQVAEALWFAHDKGLIHRDVKPANILLDGAGDAKLTDFDLARALDSTAGTRTGTGLGTFLYAAPETMQDASRAEAPADVYSLAMTVAFVLQGEELPSSVLRETESFLNRLHCPPPVRAALVRATALDPSARFASVGELSRALQGGSGEPGAGTPPVEVGVGAVEDSSWASDRGEDEHGLWASFEVEGVAHRLRWIAPGRFLMGSPEGEAGRFEREGPRHEVVLTRGFWLGETPCTQALWEAVMGENPSRFRSPNRPVEKVNWEDCQVFFERLRARDASLWFRLPTEAEWEYACRAGTSGATWLGDLEILGAHHAPLLDEIAWYGGNSGVGFDLPEGHDSSGWPKKQHPHELAGSREVGLKLANPWGLYDVLGNVWEWCEDRWAGRYPDGPRTDPTGPESGAGRVFRGGAWGGGARLVRAACRGGFPPVVRYEALGFRLARGQGRGTESS